MAQSSENELAAWEKNRDLNAELRRALREMKQDEWARKTEFKVQPDGSVRRVIIRCDGTIEIDAIIPGKCAPAIPDDVMREID
jgi:hypothetical protein